MQEPRSTRVGGLRAALHAASTTIAKGNVSSMYHTCPNVSKLKQCERTTYKPTESLDNDTKLKARLGDQSRSNSLRGEINKSHVDQVYIVILGLLSIRLSANSKLSSSGKCPFLSEIFGKRSFIR